MTWSKVVENYKLTRDKLGTGINGSVIKVQRRSDNVTGALKIIYKNAPRAEAEVKLHAYSTQCPNVSSFDLICDCYQQKLEKKTELLKLFEGSENFGRIRESVPWTRLLSDYYGMHGGW